MKYVEKNPLLILLIGVVSASLSGIFVRYSDAPPVITATSRLLWTVLLMTPFVWSKPNYRREILGLTPKQLLLCALSGICLAIHFIVWFESLNQTSVASSTAICCTEVIWVSIGYIVFMKGKLTSKSLLYIGITLLGSFLIAFSDSTEQSGHLFGDLLALLAAITVAIYTLLGRTARKTMTTTGYTYIVYTACALTLCIITAVRGYTLKDFTPSAISTGFLLAIFCNILGHSIFSWSLKYFSPSFISATKLGQPIVAACVAAVLLHETPKLLQVFGGFIVIIGVFFYSREERTQ